jgi:hypothetical protein
MILRAYVCILLASLACAWAQECKGSDSTLGAGVRVRWTAPGDDGFDGTATAYDLRFSTAYITDSNWSKATQVSGEPKPMIAGTIQSCYVSGLAEGTRYYLALKAVDEAGNWSLLSNVVSIVAQQVACGDANGDGQIGVSDAAYLIKYIFGSDPILYPVCTGDANGDGQVNVADAVYLIDYIFKGSPGPIAGCCP